MRAEYIAQRAHEVYKVLTKRGGSKSQQGGGDGMGGGGREAMSEDGEWNSALEAYRSQRWPEALERFRKGNHNTLTLTLTDHRGGQRHASASVSATAL